eukprot:CAMPEP_0116838922 /NCGR_PEP_ID=MMETSP0418-20121206/9482_1 /TAXON_ID=1158023 /ORGANISM="Astrosyne radiata, Strain 13vi08-1A" /LENGTH=76 /DNA_ID=CAMNT_0004468979 /DNA_START=98 /DNA_END=326 /DNA_ORIENTATION=-
MPTTDDSDQFDLSEYLADDHQTNELTKNQTMKNRNKNHDDLPPPQQAEQAIIVQIRQKEHKQDHPIIPSWHRFLLW